MKKTFFTPIGTHQSPRKTKSRRFSRQDCDQPESEDLGSSANVGNISRNLLTEIFNSIQKRKSILRKILINCLNKMKYLAWDNFSQHTRFERKDPSSPEKERYEGALRYRQEEEGKWRRTSQTGYEAGPSSQPEPCRPAGSVYSQSLDYYQQQDHKYF